MMIRLDPTWSRLMREYKRAHVDPRNQFCHRIGIPLIVGSLPVGITVVGLPLAAGMFSVGWAFQFAGHYLFEHNDPQFFGDWRNLLVGVLWAMEKAGVPIQLSAPAEA